MPWLRRHIYMFCLVKMLKQRRFVNYEEGHFKHTHCSVTACPRNLHDYEAETSIASYSSYSVQVKVCPTQWGTLGQANWAHSLKVGMSEEPHSSFVPTASSWSSGLVAGKGQPYASSHKVAAFTFMSWFICTWDFIGLRWSFKLVSW